MLLDSEAGEKDIHFGDIQFGGMPFVVEKNATMDPIGVRRFGENGMMGDTERLSHLVEKPWLAIHNLSLCLPYYRA